MATFFNNVARSIEGALVRNGRARARGELLRMNDRVLEDAGFSRTLLEAGVDAWPWRVTSDEPVVASAPVRTDVRTAEAELQRLSDAELDDLAIARSDIPRAVREGRFGIERPAAREQLQHAA